MTDTKAYLSGYILKEAEWRYNPIRDPHVQPAMMGAQIAGIGVATILPVLAGLRLKKSLEETPKVNRRLIDQIKDKAGMGDIPSLEIPGLDNAAYVNPGGEKSLIQAAEDSSIFPARDALREALFKHTGKDSLKDVREYYKDKANQKGLVLYDPKFATYGIIGHELGHAEQERAGGLPKFNQRYIYPYGPLAGMIAGGLTGRAISPKWGGYIGAAIGGVTGGIGEEYAERRATKFSEKVMDQSRMSESSKVRNKSLLKKALRTYNWNTLGPLAAVGIPAITAMILEHRGEIGWYGR